MKINKFSRRFLAISFGAFAALSVVSSAYAYDVYRSVTADAFTHVVNWTPANFGVSAGPAIPPPPASLSFFHFANDGAAQHGLPAAQCFVKVHLAGTGAHPAVLANDTVGNAAVGIANASSLPFPWTITFDNAPAGHWNITKGAIVNLALMPVPSNATAGTVAALGFHNLANNPGNTYGVTVVNGTLANCHA
ncbi:hypothetical protein [Rhizobium tumorigenes]|uniref:Uncharacterized protein n=1 Tax=Rhizobium tumorigenes TaxID=2041385 RepID=A0AAF1K9B9_9HYPH|nr:hypothetical protein [Rhizobium tumorigenes]WFR95012.1 hypothetical protein PR017_14555 [Rhizobium tumorigenes]